MTHSRKQRILELEPEVLVDALLEPADPDSTAGDVEKKLMDTRKRNASNPAIPTICFAVVHGNYSSFHFHKNFSLPSAIQLVYSAVTSPLTISHPKINYPHFP